MTPEWKKLFASEELVIEETKFGTYVQLDIQICVKFNA